MRSARWRSCSKRSLQPVKMDARTLFCASSARGILASLPSPSKLDEPGWRELPRGKWLFSGDSVWRRRRPEASEERLLFRFHADETCLLDVAETADLKRQGGEFDRGCMIGRR